MKFLLDASPRKVDDFMQKYPRLVLGQLITPLTAFSVGGSVFACDNGAYSAFNEKAYSKMLARVSPLLDRCLFVTLPDRVGDCASTRALYEEWKEFVPSWMRGYVLQDGEFQPPEDVGCVFVGGSSAYKDSRKVYDLLVDLKQRLDVHVHVGRINTYRRFSAFRNVADTCDGSGIVRFPSMLPRLASKAFPRYSLWRTE